MASLLGGDIRCPIARSLEVLGDRWTLMIVRDALLGATRFSQFRDSLGIPRDVLTTRLQTLVDGGVLERSTYRAEGERPRDEYLLTDAGRDLIVVIGALGDWAGRHRPVSERPLVSVADATTGHPASVTFVDAAGRAVHAARLERS